MLFVSPQLRNGEGTTKDTKRTKMKDVGFSPVTSPNAYFVIIMV